MAWESRPGGRYYYQSVKQAGRVRKIYYGRGEAAMLAERLADEAKARRAAAAAAARAELARFGPPEAAMADLDTACKLAVESVVAAAGNPNGDTAWSR
jgi:hypothetical protein